MPTGIFSFLTSFGKEKLGRVGEGIVQKIVAWDPETASQAEIEEMIKELDKITLEAGKAKAAFDKEQAEAQTVQRNYDKYLAAVELINTQHEEAAKGQDQAKAQDLEKSLGKLLADLEKMRPEVEREAHESEEAREYYEEVKQLAEVTAEKVKTARGQLEQAHREMRRAELDQQRAQTRAAQAERLAGLKSQTSNLGVALAAMNKQTEEARVKASASEMKAKLLTPPEKKEDENVQAALKLVSGEAAPEPTNFSDRLASLRKK